MNSLHSGCGPRPTARRAFFDYCTCCEIFEVSREPMRAATLAELRATAPEGFIYTTFADRWIGLDPLDQRGPAPLDLPKSELGMMRPTAANATLWERTRRQAEAVAADYVYFRPAPSFSPSTANRDALRAFRRDIIGDVPFGIVWEVRGLWDLEDARELAAELDIQVACDPYVDDEFPEIGEGNAYYILDRPRGRRVFEDDDCEDLFDYFEQHPAGVIAVFRGPERARNALMFNRHRQRYETINGAIGGA